MRARNFLLFFFLFAPAGAVCAQESKFHEELRQEGEHLKANCGQFSFKSAIGCGEVLFTGHPFHIAVGSIAPQNGVGFGAAFVTHLNPSERWRLNWNADAVVSVNGSWRAGAYMKAIYIPRRNIVMTPGGAGQPKPKLAVSQYPVLNFYAQAVSLKKITYFGLGPSTTPEDRAFFGMRETIAGANVTWPIFKPLNVSLYGEANGRFVDVRGSHGHGSPSIEQVYTEATAPGLTSQPAFAQFGEGVRIRPTFFADYLRLNYFVNFQQFIAAGDSHFSFRRLTVDLQHEIPLYKNMRSLSPRDHNGPDDCSESVSDSKHNCPAITRNREGSIGIRLLISESITPAGHVVPFYFQPTLGGGDINGNHSLPSFQDYRFRAPNVLLLRGSVEHSIYGPLGLSFAADMGKVAFARGDLDFKHMRHSYYAGLTLRAGGFPMVSLLYAWGGHEGTHTIASISPSLLGGSSRPRLD
jgi:hypothetical protein